MTAGRQARVFVWPLREDKQTVERKFILDVRVMPECNEPALWRESDSCIKVRKTTAPRQLPLGESQTAAPSRSYGSPTNVKVWQPTQSEESDNCPKLPLLPKPEDSCPNVIVIQLPQGDDTCPKVSVRLLTKLPKFDSQTASQR
ncbi:hypothetical protein DPMN_063114 [Dreissena polymorpha]|uniref:Uncharacterized protein n=1 Tax=Dreissena polymorpha TaxID=45954 RepID=A0A9D4C9W9_DREPO|nr:hypothetical protein DPMN_063114 [Dreissena polymorpha]